MAEAIKEQRAVTKGKVTKYMRKLRSALQSGANIEKVREEANELEKHFDDLNDLHIDYEEKSGVEDSIYLESISEEYNCTMKLYYNALREEREIKTRRENAPLITSIERGFKSVESGIEMLDKVDTSNFDLDAVI